MKKFLPILLTLYAPLSHGADRFQASINGVDLQLSGSGNGSVRILNYPSQFPSQIKLSRESFKAGEFRNREVTEVCEAVEDRLQLARDIPDMASVVYDQLRSQNAVQINLESFPFLNTSIVTRKLLDAARQAKLNYTAVTIENPLKLKTANIQLTLDESALSHQLDNIPVLQSEIGRLNSINLLRVGNSSVQIFAMDLLCDLVSGKAQLTVSASGDEEGPAEKVQILSAQDTAEAHGKLLAARDQFKDGVFASSCSVDSALTSNAVLASRLLASQLPASLSSDDFQRVYNALVDANGKPKSALESSLQEFGVRKDSGSGLKKYQGSSSVQVTVENKP